jgi:flagellar biosynthesis/type III secretory pathway protein FliH
MSDRIIRAGQSARVTRWLPDAMQPGGADPSERTETGTQAQAAVPSPADEEVLSVTVGELQAQFEQIRAQAFAQGLAQGQADADERHQAALQAARHSNAQSSGDVVAQLQDALAMLEQQSDAVLADLPSHVTALALGLARQILRQSDLKHSDALAQMLRRALDPLRESLRTSATVHAHPDTLASLSASLGAGVSGSSQAASHSALLARFKPDTALVPGGFVIRHADGELDLSLPLRWKQAVETFCSDVRQRQWN